MELNIGPLSIIFGKSAKKTPLKQRRSIINVFRKVAKPKTHVYACTKKAVMDDPDRKPVEQRERRWTQEL